MQICSHMGIHVLRPSGLLADDPSQEGLWFVECEEKEVLMDENPNTDLGRDKIALWTAIFGLLTVVVELVIKVVSYARSHSQFRLQLPSQR
jgi:hypothetical protein